MSKIDRKATQGQYLFRFLLALIFIVSSGCPDSSQSESRPKAKQNAEGLSVLFLGNSHTASHDVPGMVKTIADVDGQFQMRVKFIRGSFLEDLASRESVQKELQSGVWDVVVLQGQKISMSGKYIYPTESAEKLARLARKSESKLVWYCEWGREGIDDETERFQRSYDSLAEDNGGRVASTGLAWQLALKAKRNLNLYSTDGNHANPKGAFLAALTIYSTIANQDCRDLGNVDSKEVNDSLQSFFRETVAKLHDNAEGE